MTGADGMNRRTTETDMPVMQDKELTPQELVQYVRDICDAEALELMLRGNRVYIPYMMSDAVEAWCVLEDAEVPEDMPEDTENVIDAVALCAEGRQGICLRTEDGICGTIWYRRARYRQTLYQYHRIIHCWKTGYEHMRMLVYMVGTISDKLTFLGEEVVNDRERELIPLIEYKPFRDFSPIGESLDEWYPDSEKGRSVMADMAEAAGEEELAKLIRENGPEEGIRSRMAASGKLFQLLYGRICQASSAYPVRRYAPAEENRQQAMRREADRRLKKAGYGGIYPDYEKDGEKITVLEEHPFALPGADELEFALHILSQDEENGFRIKEITEITEI